MYRTISVLGLILLCLTASFAQPEVKKKKGKYGVYSSRGKELLPAAYDLVFAVDMDTMLYIVQNEEQFQLVSLEKGAMSPKFEHKICTWVLGLDGPISYLLPDEFFPVLINKKWTFMNLKGKLLNEFQFDEVSQDNQYREALFFARNGSKMYLVTGGKKKKLNVKGVEYFLGFADNYFMAMVKGKVLFFTEEGEQLEDLGEDPDNLYLAEVGCKHGVVNAKGEVVIPFLYEEIDLNTTHINVKKNGLWALFTNNGKQVSKFEFEGLANEMMDNNTRIIYYEDELSGIATAQGKRLSKAKYEYVMDVDGLKPAKIAKGYGHIDINGKWKIKPKYSYAFPFSEGLSAVQKDGKYGFINQNNELIIAFQFFRGGSFKNGKAFVQQMNKKWVYINKGGRVVEKK